MTKQISEHAAVAKIIRAELKSRGIPARVRASSASMTSSVDINLQGDPLPAVRRAVEDYAQGFTESYGRTGPTVRFAFVNTDYSDEIRAEAAALVQSTMDVERMTEHEVSMYAHRALAGSDGYLAPTLWRSRKSRVRAAA